MNFVDAVEYDNALYYTKKYMLSNNIQIDSMINIIKGFENEEIKMSFCNCNTFDGNGNSVSFRYYNVEDIMQLKENYSPYVGFSVEFCNRDSLDYCFSLLADVNSNVLSYVINKKKLNMSKSSISR